MKLYQKDLNIIFVRKYTHTVNVENDNKSVGIQI